MTIQLARAVHRRPHSRLRPSIFLAMALCLPAAASANASPDDVNGKLEAMMAHIQEEQGAGRQVKTAQGLEAFVLHLGPAGLKSIRPATLDDITDLLSSSADGVRAAAAATLGRIGSPAARELPMLRLARDHLQYGSNTAKHRKSKSFAAIQAAIDKIADG